MMLESGGLVRQEELKKRIDSTMECLKPLMLSVISADKINFTKNFKKLLIKIYEYEQFDNRILHPDDLRFIMRQTIAFLKVYTPFAYSMEDSKAIICVNLRNNKTFPLVYPTSSRASSAEFYAAKIVGMVVGELLT